MRTSLVLGLTLSAQALATAPQSKELAVHSWGQLDFRACALSTRGIASPIDAFCAQTEVPLDSSHPEGVKVKLAIAWLKALEKAGAATDPVVLLAGGPGQSAREQAAYVGRLFRELRRHHHLLFIDQRGTGESTPLSCPPVETHTPEEGAAALRACRARFTLDTRYFTTQEAVEDLEWVRRQLGPVRFDLIGVSYGTRLAQEYARSHGDNVRSMVLDGVVPSSLVLGRGFGRSLDQALAKSTGTCAGDGGCQPPLAALDEALAVLRTPERVTFSDPYTAQPRTEDFGANELMRLIHLQAYQPLFISTFPQIFRDARDGLLGPLAAQLHIVEQASGIAEGLHYAVACAEDVPQLTDADALAEAGTRLGRLSIDTYRAACRDWPHFEAPAQRLTPLKSAVPTLLLSGEWDPVTPPEGASQVAATLSERKHLVLPGQGHNVMGIGCIPRVIARFVDAGKIEGLDTACVATIKPLKPFTSRTGWDP